MLSEDGRPTWLPRGIFFGGLERQVWVVGWRHEYDAAWLQPRVGAHTNADHVLPGHIADVEKIAKCLVSGLATRAGGHREPRFVFELVAPRGEAAPLAQHWRVDDFPVLDLVSRVIEALLLGLVSVDNDAEIVAVGIHDHAALIGRDVGAPWWRTV
jgi:hypothetical protein